MMDAHHIDCSNGQSAVCVSRKSAHTFLPGGLYAAYSMQCTVNLHALQVAVCRLQTV